MTGHVKNQNPETFYDELAEFYDLIFDDWNASMDRQGDAVAGILKREVSGASGPIKVLDAAAGIGTQSLPLAARQFDVTSRDVSSAAIARLQREANAKALQIDAAVADMREVDESLTGRFDAVIAFDNSVAHLLTDNDILDAFRSFFRSLRPGGLCLLSVRDYDQVTRGEDLVHAYGVRWRDDVRHVPIQLWRWIDDDYYDATFYVLVDREASAQTHRTTTRFRAVSVARLLQLLAEAGFEDCARLDETIYQPIIRARVPLSRAV